MGNTINEVGSWLNANVWRPVEIGLFNFQESVDRYAGRVVNWNPAEITTSDRAAAVLTLFAAASPLACEQQEESSKSAEEDISQPKDVAAEINQKPKGWAFCAKKDVDDLEDSDNCFKNKNIQDKLSTCVYLTEVAFDATAKCSNFSPQTNIYYDHDSLMTLLLSQQGCLNVTFEGDNEWPQDFFDKGIPFFKYCSPALCPSSEDLSEDVWKGLDDYIPRGHLFPPTIAYIFADKSSWTAQVKFHQPPDLCWAVYETPCADESVCE